MAWKARAHEDFTIDGVEIRIADLYSDHMAVLIGNGDVQRLPPDVEVPVFCRLPVEAAEALRDALNGYMPPTSDTDLRDALAIERGRVDRIIDRAVRDA